MPARGLGVDREQLVDPRHQPRRQTICRIELDRLVKLPSRMRPAGRVDHLRPAHPVVSGVAIGLQNTFKVAQKLLSDLPVHGPSESQTPLASRPAVLPEVSLMILPAPIVHLHRNRRLIRLHIAPATNSRLIAAANGISNSPTRITQPSIVARLISTPVSRSRIALCRYSGR